LNSAIELLIERAQRVADGEPGSVPSPCVSVCRMDAATDLCEGCFRTLDEIAAWGRMTEEDKREVWALIARRLPTASDKENDA
jgi:predicted Fe-S protein YdhL (DUF1289 family)